MLINVTVSRAAYSELTITVEAPSREEAMRIALLVAPDREFPNAHSADYEALGTGIPQK